MCCTREVMAVGGVAMWVIWIYKHTTYTVDFYRKPRNIVPKPLMLRLELLSSGRYLSIFSNRSARSSTPFLSAKFPSSRSFSLQPRLDRRPDSRSHLILAKRAWQQPSSFRCSHSTFGVPVSLNRAHQASEEHRHGSGSLPNVSIICLRIRVSLLRKGSKRGAPAWISNIVYAKTPEAKLIFVSKKASGETSSMSNEREARRETSMGAMTCEGARGSGGDPSRVTTSSVSGFLRKL